MKDNVRVFHKSLNVAVPGSPRYDKKRHPLTVGRGPVPRHRSRNPTLAGDRPPRYDKKRPLTVGRGSVPRHRSRKLNRSSLDISSSKC